MRSINVHRVLCQCNGCKGKQENKFYLEIIQKEDKLTARVRGLFFNSTRINIKLIDLENMIKNIKQIKEKK